MRVYQRARACSIGRIKNKKICACSSGGGEKCKRALDLAWICILILRVDPPLQMRVRARLRLARPPVFALFYIRLLLAVNRFTRLPPRSPLVRQFNRSEWRSH